jgi:hypothetical protein
MSTLPAPLVAFLREARRLRVDDGALAAALRAIDEEGNEVEDAANLITALARVAALPWPFARRLAAMSDLLAQRGKVTVTFTRDTMHITSRPAA